MSNQALASLADRYAIGEEAETTTPQAPSEPPSRARRPDGTFLPKEPESPPAHSRQTLRLAQDLGVSDEFIAATPPEQLDEYVYQLNKQRLEMQAEFSRQDAARTATEPRPPVQPLQPAVPVQEPVEDDFELSDDEFDPKLVKALKAAKREIDGLRSQLAQANEFVQSSKKRSMADRIDAVFAQNEQTKGLSRKTMKPGTPEHLKAMGILRTAELIAKSDDDLEAAVQQAIEAMYGKPQAAAATPPSTPGRPTVEDWQNGTLARPTHRQTDEPPGERKAMQTASRIMRERGMIDGGETSMDGFLE